MVSVESCIIVRMKSSCARGRSKDIIYDDSGGIQSKVVLDQQVSIKKESVFYDEDEIDRGKERVRFEQRFSTN